MLFADVSDIAQRWRELDASEMERAETLIEDASAMLARLVGNFDVADESYMQLLKQTCCNMVIRSLGASGNDATYGVDSMSITAGPYSQNWSYNNPTGDMYLTKLEKKLLGISGAAKGRTLIYGMAGDYDARC